MAYIAPNFKIDTTENTSIDFLEASDASELEIIGYQERQLIGKTDRDLDAIKTEPLNFKKFTKTLPLCKGPENKYWVLNDKGELNLEYIK
jgi:hypothetical protein|tara:strand:- start:6957 stop:7226 length:270 start_codon:yes stop_codon:yes gene_type:complete